jgi:prophage regulatory protein
LGIRSGAKEIQGAPKVPRLANSTCAAQAFFISRVFVALCKFFHRKTMHNLKNHPTAALGNLLRLPNVLQLSGLSRSSIYEGIKSHSFPCPIRIGKRAVAWREVDIQEWLNSRPLVTLNRSNGESL